MRNILLICFFSFFILCSCLVNKNNYLEIKESNLIQETNLKKSAGEDFGMLVNLMADDHVKMAIKNARFVDINGFKILYSTPDEIFIIKNNNVIARIVGNKDKTFYNSTLAPLSGKEVHLTESFIFYNNSNNSFIDYGIDGIDVIEENHLDILNTKLLDDVAMKLPNMSFINNQICTTLPNLSRTACCGKTGYEFTWEKGWQKQKNITEKCDKLQ